MFVSMLKKRQFRTPKMRSSSEWSLNHHLFLDWTPWSALLPAIKSNVVSFLRSHLVFSANEKLCICSINVWEMSIFLFPSSINMYHPWVSNQLAFQHFCDLSLVHIFQYLFSSSTLKAYDVGNSIHQCNFSRYLLSISVPQQYPPCASFSRSYYHHFYDFNDAFYRILAKCTLEWMWIINQYHEVQFISLEAWKPVGISTSSTATRNMVLIWL